MKELLAELEGINIGLSVYSYMPLLRYAARTKDLNLAIEITEKAKKKKFVFQGDWVRDLISIFQRNSVLPAVYADVLIPQKKSKNYPSKN